MTAERAALQHRWLDRAIVGPFRAPTQPDFEGGLELPGEPWAPALRHQRMRRPVDRPLAGRAPAPPRMAGRFLYGGPLILEFGHFMTESIHRILPGLAIEPGLPVLFAGLRQAAPVDLRAVGHVRQVFEFLGLPAQRVQVIHRAVSVDELLVVEQGSDLGCGPKPAYLDLLDGFSPRRLAALAASGPLPERVYVSRSRMPAGRLLGETYLESRLAVAGYTVYRPEEHPLVHQMQTYRGARHLIFPEGSACHGAELLGRDLQHVALLNRRPVPRPAVFSAALKPRAQHYAEFLGNRFLGALPIGMTRPPLAFRGVSVFDLPGLLDFLAAEGLADLRRGFDADACADAARREFAEHVAWAFTHPKTQADALHAAIPTLEAQLSDALAGRC